MVIELAIVKHIAVHSTPMRLLSYVVNGEKTSGHKLVSGLYCTDDAEHAYKEMKRLFELFSGERFHKRSIDTSPFEEKKKEKIRLHHYIQSFKQGEVTPEEAHKIGVEWAKKVFGEERPVIVSTHTDKNHIHNHFAVSAYDINGKKWYDNETTLQQCRDISDSICKAHGLSVIEKPQQNTNSKYSDWLARKTKSSWKEKMCDDIDRVILDDNVKCLDDLVDKLRKLGYEVRYGKYISIKGPNNSKGIRSFRLGDGYAVDELRYRIENKDKEMSLSEVARYEGIQKEYAMCLRELQIIVYRRAESQYKASYSELRKNAELLCYLSDNKIHSVSDFERIVNGAAEKADKLKKSCKEMQEQLTQEEKISKDGERYVELNDILFPSEEELQELKAYKYLDEYDLYSPRDVELHRQELARLKEELPKAQEQLKAAEAEKKKAAQNYQTYIRQRQTDYDFIYEKLRREKEEMEKAERQIERERDSSTPERKPNKKNIIGE